MNFPQSMTTTSDKRAKIVPFGKGKHVAVIISGFVETPGACGHVREDLHGACLSAALAAVPGNLQGAQRQISGSIVLLDKRMSLS